MRETKIRAQNLVLGLGVGVCFVETLVAPKGSDPGWAAAAVLGILLIRRAIIITPQPTAVIVAGWFLTTLVVAGDHGLVNINKPIWIVSIFIGFVIYGLWEKIEKRWRQRHRSL